MFGGAPRSNPSLLEDGFPSSKLCMRGGGLEIDHCKLQLRQREIDYHPIAGPPGEIFDKFRSTSNLGQILELYVKISVQPGQPGTTGTTRDNPSHHQDTTRGSPTGDHRLSLAHTASPRPHARTKRFPGWGHKDSPPQPPSYYSRCTAKRLPMPSM